MKAELLYKTPKSMLNKGSGFLANYSHSLNPYAGCSFACSYCYVRQSPVNLFRDADWGTWVDVKTGAAQVLAKELRLAKSKGPVTIFMSSSTDPYQPVEAKERVTRSLLEVMVDNPPDFLFLQTRSPLVSRDIDLLLRMKDRVRVSMTVETDLEEIRRHFSPFAPPIGGRLKALATLAEAGVPTQAAIAPILPSSAHFAQMLRGLVTRVCIDDFYMGDGSGGKRTKRLNLLPLYEQLGLTEWYGSDAYKLVRDRLLDVFKPEQVLVSQEGFAP
ncbi:DNA repair photolyase [Paenibacillus phyllosphaerae]|uniref:DNA repair photolyase n=1 Tax=Paenibacillus phyllosphaerae TaxID=274593 RepID=A0A7W5AYM5_9BACL|nr:radical SAM protein [Paenibacillus phyllosphaerae]MBB3111183.1 DNA repair photolyase [Paenibacillus phyllosphaerae]